MRSHFANPKNVIKKCKKEKEKHTCAYVTSLDTVICLSINEKYNSLAKFY